MLGSSKFIFILVGVDAWTHSDQPCNSDAVTLVVTFSDPELASATKTTGRVGTDADRSARGSCRTGFILPLKTTRSLIQPLRMSPNPTFEPPNLKKPLLTEVVEAVPPPPYDVVDVEAAIPQPTLALESRPVSRVKAFFLMVAYTVAFAIVSLLICLRGSLTIGFGYDERSAAFARATYASTLGSVILGQIYFANQRFVTFMKTRGGAVNTHMASGRLLKALGCSVLFSIIVTGVVTSAATFGSGLIFWPVMYSDSLTTEEMVVDAVLIPVACLLGGLRWTYEMVGMMMWVLVRIPKISTGLEGDKYDRLMRIACVFVLFVSQAFFSDVGCLLASVSPSSGTSSGVLAPLYPCVSYCSRRA
jgi:hypothetical protein